MKKYIISIIFLLYSINVFAVNFETGLYASVGLNINIFEREESGIIKYGSKTKGFIGGEYGILGNIGANFDIPNATLKSISALIDFGYYKTILSKIIEPDKLYFTFFDVFNLGFLGKLNFNNNFSFGIGAGVMFPFSGFTLDSNDNTKRFNYGYIKDNYTKTTMPYIKLVFEGRYYLKEKLLFIYGASLSYNFGMEYKNPTMSWYNENGSLITSYDNEKYSYINISIFVGISFGRPK
ncbi:hypothetical protein [Brachyspira aalborgi]|uniref:hypothetical protein n=1 Tax=Brachyspira aalborgi TaxID=29522 RepID=UPI00266B7B1C|nr:hypothetical protein [Brachyspira aalborgi]